MSDTVTNKTTLVPLSNHHWNLKQSLPFRIYTNVTVENVEGLLTEKHFDLWREYIAAEDRRQFESVNIALVNNFYSAEHLGPPEHSSHELLYRIFLSLRLVRPTRIRFSVIQFKTEQRTIDVFRLTHPLPFLINMPSSEILNTVSIEDLERVRQVIPSFLNLAENGPENLRRAMRFYEEAYSDIRDPVLQLVTWTAGIESALATSDEPMSYEELLSQIKQQIPNGSDIYADSQLREFSRLPTFAIDEAIHDLIKLRNRIVHGLWIPPEWRNRTAYRDAADHPVVYADALRDVAAFVLRTVVLAKLGFNFMKRHEQK